MVGPSGYIKNFLNIPKNYGHLPILIIVIPFFMFVHAVIFKLHNRKLVQSWIYIKDHMGHIGPFRLCFAPSTGYVLLGHRLTQPCLQNIFFSDLFSETCSPVTTPMSMDRYLQWTVLS